MITEPQRGNAFMQGAKKVEVEIFVRADKEAPLLQALIDKVGTLSRVFRDDGSGRIYVREGVGLVITDSQDGFVSAWLSGVGLWHSSVSCARFIHVELGCEVRCDPGADYPGVSPYSNTFLKICEGSEVLFDWP